MTSTTLEYLQKIAASAHIITLQRLLARVREVNVQLQSQLELPAPDVEASKRQLTRATEALSALEDGLDNTDGHRAAMEAWHVELLGEVLEGAVGATGDMKDLVRRVEAAVSGL